MTYKWDYGKSTWANEAAKHAQMSASERQERYRADRGYIGNGGTFDGIVICGDCMTNVLYSDPGAYRDAQFERYNPSAGDDFCSVCDRDITSAWSERELTTGTQS